MRTAKDNPVTGKGYGDSLLGLVPEQFRAELLDKLAWQLSEGESIDPQLRAMTEARAWRGILSLAEQHPEEWAYLVQFLIGTARNYADECATVVQQESAPHKVFGLVKARAGASFGLFVAANALTPESIRRRAKLAI